MAKLLTTESHTYNYKNQNNKYRKRGDEKL